jgi:hypothetical protein
MRVVLFVFLSIMIVISSSLSDEDIPGKIRALETELSPIQRESNDIPTEEIKKASQWINDANLSFSSGKSERASLILQKASYQIAFLNAIDNELKRKKEFDEMSEFLQKIEAVKDYLVSKGLSPKRFKAEGFGTSNLQERDKVKSHGIEFTLESSESSKIY